MNFKGTDRDDASPSYPDFNVKMLSIRTVYATLLANAGSKHLCPKISNKGRVGHLVEELCGIPKSSNPLDCFDGEVKCFPLKRLKDGTLVPKETIAITMLQPGTLLTTEFVASNAYKKLANCLYVPYLRTSDTIRFFKPYILSVPPCLMRVLYRQFKADYVAIQDAFRATGTLHNTSQLGVYLQNRTKGSKSSTSRAFYLRPVFLKKYVIPHCLREE